MARKKATKGYFEPWTAAKSAAHGKDPFPCGIPEGEYPEGVAETIHEAWQRRDRDAEWVIWGSKMADPSLCVTLGGSFAAMNDRRIIAVQRKLGLAEGTPGHEEVAKRIVACVNACAGIADPEKFIADVRALLLGYVKGECEDPRDDSRVVGLLGRCIPPEELEKLHESEIED